jgi:hypothetical protein
MVTTPLAPPTDDPSPPAGRGDSSESALATRDIDRAAPGAHPIDRSAPGARLIDRVTVGEAHTQEVPPR